jgi:site-specific DNA-methyltransferase (adenine-specific)
LGDCLEILPTLADGSVDLTVTSPPYDNLRTYNGSLDDWTPEKWKAIISELHRVTKRGGVVVWVVGDATIKGSETGTSFRQALWAMECGFRLHDTMIWKKTLSYAFDGRQHRYKPMFEYMFVFAKNGPSSGFLIKDVPNKSAGRVGSGKKGRTRDGALRLQKPVVIGEFQVRSNVWEVGAGYNASDEYSRKHPAPFPVALATDHILSWSGEGESVLDPFMGSGTTGVAARNTNRNFIGIERDPSYFAIAEQRINGANDKIPAKTPANDNTPRAPDLFGT